MKEEQEKLKDIPEKIYLQIGEDCDAESFNELGDVSWCADKINDNDIEYRRTENVLSVDKIMSILKRSETGDIEPPYRCLPIGHSEWFLNKAKAIHSAQKEKNNE